MRYQLLLGGADALPAQAEVARRKLQEALALVTAERRTSYAVTDAAGGQDIIVPDDKWFSEKWVIKHDLYCTKTSVMTDRIRAFFQ